MHCRPWLLHKAARSEICREQPVSDRRNRTTHSPCQVCWRHFICFTSVDPLVFHCRLDLRDCAFSDPAAFAPLSSNLCLTTLYLKGNPLESDPAIDDIRVQVCFFVLLSPARLKNCVLLTATLYRERFEGHIPCLRIIIQRHGQKIQFFTWSNKTASFSCFELTYMLCELLHREVQSVFRNKFQLLIPYFGKKSNCVGKIRCQTERIVDSEQRMNAFAHTDSTQLALLCHSWEQISFIKYLDRDRIIQTD